MYSVTFFIVPMHVQYSTTHAPMFTLALQHDQTIGAASCPRLQEALIQAAFKQQRVHRTFAQAGIRISFHISAFTGDIFHSQIKAYAELPRQDKFAAESR